MPFTITIVQTGIVVRKVVGKDWAVVGREGDGDKDKPVYGYTPEIEKAVYTDRKVLEQSVETLDLHAVIKAINGL